MKMRQISVVGAAGLVGLAVLTFHWLTSSGISGVSGPQIVSGGHAPTVFSAAPSRGDTPGASSAIEVQSDQTSAVSSSPNSGSSQSASEVIRQLFAKMDADQQVDAGHQKFGNPLLQLHSAFASEKPDAAWSPLLESHLATYFNQKLNAADDELVSVQCAVSMCEIEGASASAEAADKASDDWNSVVSGMTIQPWWQADGFTDHSTTVFVSDDGRSMFVVYVKRDTQRLKGRVAGA
jgi:hypothetical protein